MKRKTKTQNNPSPHKEKQHYQHYFDFSVILERRCIKTKAGGREEEIICEQREFLGVKNDFLTKILQNQKRELKQKIRKQSSWDTLRPKEQIQRIDDREKVMCA